MNRAIFLAALALAGCNPADSAPRLTWEHAQVLAKRCEEKGLQPAYMHIDRFYDPSMRVRWVWCTGPDGALFEQSQE